MSTFRTSARASSGAERKIDLKEVVTTKLCQEFRSVSAAAGSRSGRERVLCVDETGRNVVSSCLTVDTLFDEFNIDLLEDLKKTREPQRHANCIYFIAPLQSSVDCVVTDFAGSRKYRHVYILFTHACPDALLRQLSQARVSARIKLIREVGINFNPVEPLVFTLGNLFHSEKTTDAARRRGCNLFFCAPGGQRQSRRDVYMREMAEQLLTLCDTLEEIPVVRYRAECGALADLVHHLAAGLQRERAKNPGVATESYNKGSTLLVLDRGFDCISPVVHELTFQAMAYDVLKRRQLERNTFHYQERGGAGHAPTRHKMALDASNSVWVKLRHQYVTDVTSEIVDELKKFSTSDRFEGERDMRAEEVQRMLKDMPQYQRELRLNMGTMRMVQECLAVLERSVVQLEQDILDKVMHNHDYDERVETQILQRLSGQLKSPRLSPTDKVRLLLVYILANEGIPRRTLERLWAVSQLTDKSKACVRALSTLGRTVTRDNYTTTAWPVERRRRPVGPQQLVRWTPLLKDLLEDCCEFELCPDTYPTVNEHRSSRRPRKLSSAARMRRVPTWAGPKARLIVFILGGVTYSETRTCYEVSSNDRYRGWDVIIGSDSLLTPVTFLDTLASMAP